MGCGGLMKEVELAIGALVMVTLNILTELDVANEQLKALYLMNVKD